MSTSAPSYTVEPLIDERAIAGRVAELGDALSRAYAGRDVVLVGVLTGAVPFLADLMRCMRIPLEVELVAVSSYGSRTVSSGEVRILKDLGHPVSGKHVVLVEDIVDTGLTLQYLVDYLRAREPASVSTCVLLDKPARRKTEVAVDHVGFVIEDRFVVGYGLDYAGLYRNLPYIGVLSDNTNAHGVAQP